MRLLLAFTLALVAASAPAQPPHEPKDGKTVIPMTVSASPAPKLALKHQLLPELRDTLPGNQIQAFYKCFMEQHHLYRGKEAIEKREKWLVAPLAELAGEKELIGYGGSSSKQADHAAHLDAVDWAILSQLQREGIYLLLPDVQQLRELASVLKLKLRGEVARGEFDAAVRTAKVMFALARAFEDHPTLIGQLVGIAITSMTLDALEEFVRQPAAPNLFWPLADMPTPFISLRKGMQGERTWLGKQYDVLAKADVVPEAELKRLADTLTPILQFEGSKRHATWLNWTAQAADAATVKDARARLVAFGHAADAVGKLPPVQVVMADDFTRYLALQDDLMKWMNQPYWKLPAEFDSGRAAGIFGELPASMLKVKQSQARVQQRFALLGVIEAVRLYAGANDGKVPASLDAVKLPLPSDPFTGKPFAYEVKDGVGVLRATPPPDMLKNAAYNRVYEITIRK